jgi:hypothetical protein
MSNITPKYDMFQNKYDFPLHRVYSSVLSINTGFISSQWYKRKYFMGGLTTLKYKKMIT